MGTQAVVNELRDLLADAALTLDDVADCCACCGCRERVDQVIEMFRRRQAVGRVLGARRFRPETGLGGGSRG